MFKSTLEIINYVKTIDSNIISGFGGALIGGFLSIVTTFLSREMDDKQKNKHNASMLYYDLKSIEKYITNFSELLVDIRYSNDWQSMVANCPFLKSEHVEIIYDIYDNVYDFDYMIKNNKLSTAPSSIPSYNNLKSYITSPGYNKIIKELRNKAGIQ